MTPARSAMRLWEVEVMSLLGRYRDSHIAIDAPFAFDAFERDVDC